MTEMPTITDEQRIQCMIEALRAQGCRITPQRLAIVGHLAESRDHPNVEEIHAAVTRTFPTTSLATVYKTVGLLKELGEVMELGVGGLESRYDGNPRPHPHVICVRCGKIEDVHGLDQDSEELDRFAQRAAELTGYTITSRRMDFFGYCPKCRAAKDTTS